jgi:hypothetical protein
MVPESFLRTEFFANLAEKNLEIVGDTAENKMLQIISKAF